MSFLASMMRFGGCLENAFWPCGKYSWLYSKYVLAMSQIIVSYVANTFGFVANMKNLWATGCAECEAMRQWRRPNPRPPFSRLPRCIVLLCHPLYSACIRAHRVFPQIVFCNPRPYYSYVGLLVSFWRQVGHLQTRDVTCEGITIRQMLRDERHKSTSLDIDLEYSKYSRRAVLGITVGATCAGRGNNAHNTCWSCTRWSSCEPKVPATTFPWD